MLKRLFSILIMSAAVPACSSESSIPAQPLPGGELHVTALGLKVYWYGASRLYPTLSSALEEVDRQVDNFLVEFGGPNPYRLNGPLDTLRLYPVKVFPDVALPGGNREIGRTWYGLQVDVAMDGAFYDIHLRRYSIGLQILVHEFRHVLQGEWHP